MMMILVSSSQDGGEDSFDSSDASNDTDEPDEKGLYLTPLTLTQVFF